MPHEIVIRKIDRAHELSNSELQHIRDSMSRVISGEAELLLGPSLGQYVQRVLIPLHISPSFRRLSTMASVIAQGLSTFANDIHITEQGKAYTLAQSTQTERGITLINTSNPEIVFPFVGEKPQAVPKERRLLWAPDTHYAFGEREKAQQGLDVVPGISLHTLIVAR